MNISPCGIGNQCVIGDIPYVLVEPEKMLITLTARNRPVHNICMHTLVGAFVFLSDSLQNLGRCILEPIERRLK
jgi:hypothetical protein